LIGLKGFDKIFFKRKKEKKESASSRQVGVKSKDSGRFTAGKGPAGRLNRAGSLLFKGGLA
jgi:hypothetical protein